MSDDWWATPDKVQSVLREEIKIRDDLIEALTEQRDEACRDAVEAEAYAMELERDLNICRMAQVVMDNTVADLERERDEWKASWQEVLTAGYEIKAKLAKAVELGDKMAKSIEGNYYTPGLVGEWRATLAEIESSTPYGLEGEKP